MPIRGVGNVELTVRFGRSGLVSAALLAATLLVGGAASAAPSAADRETARSLMEQARDLRDKGNLKDALKRFQAANDIMHVPTTALEVARAQVAVGLLVEARDTVATLRQIPSDHDSPIFKAARAAAEELDAALGGRVPSLTIALKGLDAGQEAAVAIDGVPVPAAVVGLPRTVDPGHHVITAKAPKAEGKQEFDIREGEQKPVEVTMVAIEGAEPAPADQTPATPPEEGSSGAKSHAPGTLAWIGIGVTGAGVIAGSVTGIMALSKKSSLSSQCANQICGPSSYSTLDSANLMATLSDISFGVAGAGAVLAVVALVRGTGGASTPATAAPPATGVRVTPWVTGNAAGVSGSF